MLPIIFIIIGVVIAMVAFQKYLSYVMGMKTSAYWVGTFAFDILMFWLPFGILLLVIGCFPSS